MAAFSSIISFSDSDNLDVFRGNSTSTPASESRFLALLGHDDEGELRGDAESMQPHDHEIKGRE